MSGIIAQNSGRHTGLVKASSGGGGVWNLILTQTASSDSDLSFVEGTDGVDFTAYDEFVFKFINIHPQTDGTYFTFNMSTDTGSNYNVTKTSTWFQAAHTEDDSSTEFAYNTSYDLAQSTAFQYLDTDISSDNDHATSGEICLFNPSSTTFVKHFMVVLNQTNLNNNCKNPRIAGYGNTTSAVDAVQFKMASGNIDAGTISLYGIS
jgi:hypothetical protein